MSGWHSEALGAQATQILDGDRGKNYPSKQQLFPSGHCLFLSAANVTKRGFDFSSCEFISAEKDNLLRKGKLQRHDCVLTTRGTVGNVAYFGQEVSFDNIRINSGMVVIRPDQYRLLPKFLSFFLRSEAFSDQIVSLTSGSAQPQLPIRDLKQVQIPIPPLHEQREIAAILGALDDKIELNRKTAATLEEMARALYRSWFVDFDPVWAKLEGRAPAYMAPATAALFPDRFDDEGLPEGWEWHKFEDYYDVLETGKRPKGGVAGIVDGIPSIGAESIKKVGAFDFGKTKYVPRDFFEKMKKGRVQEGDILVYKDGGKPGELRPAATYVSEGFPFETACINEHVFRIRLSADLGQHFGFLAISSLHCMHQMRELATGVAQPGLNLSAMNALSFLCPSEIEVLRAFEHRVAPLLDGCNEKAKESQTLANLRDTLLPRLMSGDLLVGEAREQVEDVA